MVKTSIGDKEDMKGAQRTNKSSVRKSIEQYRPSGHWKEKYS